MSLKLVTITTACALTLMSFVSVGAVHANEYEAELKSFAEDVKGWIGDPVVIDAVKMQNEKNASLGQADIDELDKQWRAETSAASQPMIDEVLGRDLSSFLKQKSEESEGLITEIFVMDNKGLNVGQSGITSDYWQGDEAKWQETYSAGKDAIHLGDVELDESTQTYQSQLSLPVVDAADGSVIGAVTVGINVELLQ
ncbi:PDC sensor domain-containing protein [Thalassospira lucentensis]|nr:PDC sensor domain-containing protein [Thalassospira lucentensis]